MNLEEVMQKQNKSCGAGTMFYGNNLRYHPPRLPTGVFAVDFISAGGAPLHGSTCFWGGETGAKTYLAIRAMKMAANMCWRCFNTKKFCVCSENALSTKSSWIDIEGTLEKEWVNTCGVDPNDYVVTLADCAEDGIDCADMSLQADDCGLVVIDSLGALFTTYEMNRNPGDSNMGVHPSFVTQAVKRLKLRMIRERKRDHPCVVIFVNQMRKDPTVKFGSKETQAGGHAMRHEFSLLFRCGKKALTDKKKYGKYFDDARDRWIASLHTCAIYKEKTFILSRLAEFIIIKENSDVFGLSAGEVNDSKEIIKRAQEYNLLIKEKEGHRLKDVSDDKFKTITEVQKFLIHNKDESLQLQKKIIEEAIAKVKGE